MLTLASSIWGHSATVCINFIRVFFIVFVHNAIDGSTGVLRTPRICLLINHLVAWVQLVLWLGCLEISGNSQWQFARVVPCSYSVKDFEARNFTFVCQNYSWNWQISVYTFNSRLKKKKVIRKCIIRRSICAGKWGWKRSRGLPTRRGLPPVIIPCTWPWERPHSSSTPLSTPQLPWRYLRWIFLIRLWKCHWEDHYRPQTGDLLRIKSFLATVWAFSFDVVLSDWYICISTVKCLISITTHHSNCHTGS